MGGGIYTPAELTVTEFPAERGFYTTDGGDPDPGLNDGPQIPEDDVDPG